MKTKNRFNDERGLIAPISLIIMAVMFFVTGSFASMLIYETREAAKLKRRIQAFHIAEGAVERAIYQLDLDTTWRAGWSNVSLGAGKYTVTVSDVDSSRVKVMAAATVESISRKVSMYLIKGESTPPFNYAAFGNESVKVTKGKIASYNSGVSFPPTDFNLANSNGDIATNSINSNSIDVDNPNGTVKGNAIIGVSGDPTDIQDATRITGTKTAATTATKLISVKLPGIYTSLSDIKTSTVLAAGNYFVNKIDLKGTDVLTTTGPVKIFVGDSLKVAGNAVIKAGSNKPADMAIYGLDPMQNQDLDISGMERYQANDNAVFYGVLYAPRATIRLNGSNTGTGVTAAGSFVGKQVKINGNSTIYYDEAVKNNTTLQITSLPYSRSGSWEGDF